jgi:hypothetical protein
MRAIIFTFTSMLVLFACASGAGQRPFAGPLPNDTQLDMAGTFTLSPDGDLLLMLAQPCIVEKVAKLREQTVALPCDRAHRDAIRVVAVTPWADEIRGTWSDANNITFHVDWKHSRLDPLAADAAAVVGRPWTISGTQWMPTSAEAERILTLTAVATETEIDLRHGEPAPSLEVTLFDVDGHALHAGGEATLAVRIANRGPGTAYRVVAMTRSSIDSLHGRQLSFGMIKSGAEKLRRIRVTVPITEAAPDTMLVLVPAEGNGFAPPNVSRRMPITVAETALVLSVHCTIANHDGVRPDVNAGETITLRCMVDNAGKSAAKVEMEASIAGGTPARSPAQDVRASGRTAFDLPMVISRELTIDSTVEIVVTARDRQLQRSARTTVAGIVRKPKVCAAGQLTREQYRAKLTELRAAVAAGDLTQAQLDRYDAELVTCLK